MLIKTKSLKEFEGVALGFAKKLRPNTQGATVVLLSGDLGAGKTTMTQVIGKNFGVEKVMQSPTFMIIRNYELKINNFEQLFHIDAYRLESEKEIEKLGFQEIISNPKNLVLIEWPEKIKKILPRKVFKISIEHINEKERLVEIDRSF
ncbi:MAG TPA: tRNA (adenosine(37)-N6)-threonylcarbamoyltransferase complex ATPase subunit type 1 TsaE [Candidatus Paceibacterota bacterium]|nr:tRNA (adenosine(37)-N6)-threonylcarbamoyltransferase complex ATPase subunit type 1 TsaE [Candidatus Paceibacterota bacterium]